MNELRDEIRHEGLENAVGRFYSFYRGFIADNEDPEFLGRIKLTVPQLLGDMVTDWAYSKGMPAGVQQGLYAIPDVGDMVWVSFEMGDPHYPVWEYGHFAKPNGTSDVPNDWNNNGNKPTMQVWQSKAGHRIKFDGKEGSEKIIVENKQGYQIVMDKDGISLVFPDNKKLWLGALNSGSEAAILGAKFKSWLDADTSGGVIQKCIDLATKVSTLTVDTPVGTGVISAALGVQIAQLATDLTALKGTIHTFLSTKTFLDK